LNAGQLNALQHNPNVAYIERDGNATTMATESNATWGLDRTDQRGVTLSGTYRYTNTGAGVTAYIIDTGIDCVAANRKLPASANMSLGGGASTTVDDAVKRLIAAGVATAVAAGNCVDFFAPGAGITSAWMGSGNTETSTIRGTSMATPRVAGVAALYLQSNPGASNQPVRDALFAATTKSIVTSSKTGNNHLLFTSY
jgi:subtilisin family serine protease